MADRSRRFAWVARGLSPRQAQRVHALGLPGLAFRTELKRAYPLGALAGHLLGTVNIDNKGTGRHRAHARRDGPRRSRCRAPGRTDKAPLRLSLDIGVQHALAEELQAGLRALLGAGAAGLVLDADSGRGAGRASRCREADPSRPGRLAAMPPRADRLTGGTYELGSIFKTLTVAMALEAGIADLDKIYDVRQPLIAGPLHHQGPAPAGPAAQRARDLPPLLQRRRRHAGARGRRRAAARVPGAPRA